MNPRQQHRAHHAATPGSGQREQTTRFSTFQSLFDDSPQVPESNVYRLRQSADAPVLLTSGSWSTIFNLADRTRLTELLIGSTHAPRWFASTHQTMRGGQILDIVHIPYETSMAYLVLLLLDFQNQAAIPALLPLAYAADHQANHIQTTLPQALVAHIWSQDGYGVLYHALWNTAFCRALLHAVVHRRCLRGEQGWIRAIPACPTQASNGASANHTGQPCHDHTPLPHTTQIDADEAEHIALLHPRIVHFDQHHTSIAYDEQFFLKLFQTLQEGVHPEQEISCMLTEHAQFAQSAPVIGSFEYANRWDEPTTIAFIQRYIPHTGNAWDYTLQAIRNSFRLAVTSYDVTHHDVGSFPTALVLATHNIAPPPLAQEIIGSYLDIARLIGRQTADMHRALVDNQANPAFATEPFSNMEQRSIYQRICLHTNEVFASLHSRMEQLPAQLKQDAATLAQLQELILKRYYRVFMQRVLQSKRIRSHGNYHLKQLLATESNFVIVGFGKTPADLPQDHQHKESPCYDLASMLHSFQAATWEVVLEQLNDDRIHRGQYEALLAQWAHFWYQWVAATFLQEYLQFTQELPIALADETELAALLSCYQLDCALLQLEDELLHASERLPLSRRKIVQLFAEYPLSGYSAIPCK
jgi:maltose alpha-D-glucosyltransferase/alpha-amylase